jgi:hypothetical protein
MDTPMETAPGGSGESWWDGRYEAAVVVGWRSCRTRGRERSLVQKSETEPPGLDFGHEIGKGSGRQWEDVVGSAYEVATVVGSCVRQRKAGGGFGPKSRKPSHYGSVWSWICDVSGCVKSSELTGPPSHGNISGGELGVSCLGERG